MNSKSKVMLITGGLGGIGIRIVKLFYQKNFNVIILDNKKKIFFSKLNFDNKKNFIKYYKVDLSKPISIKKKFSSLKKQYKSIDVLINCVGIQYVETIESFPINKWEKIRSVRKVVTGAIELERREKRIGSSLEAFPTIFISDKEYFDIFKDIDLAEIFITSQAILEQGDGPSTAFRLEEMKMISVKCNISVGEKCSRSWKILPEVEQSFDKKVCQRCSNVLMA